jgi:hypothetical protein
MAIDFGRAARGIATGYLSAKIADTEAQDELNREFILQAGNQYYNVDKPNFIADEKKRTSNIELISTKLSPVYANYADARGLTTDDTNTKIFIDSINDLSKEDQYKVESSIISRKKERTKTFDEQNKFITDQFANLPGGPGSMNITKMFFPNEGQDIAEVGVKQGDMAQSTASLKSVMEIEGTGGSFDIEIARHAATANQASRIFDTNFFDSNTRTYNFNVGPESDLADDVKFLKEGFEEVKANKYPFGFATYARDKFIKSILEAQGIQNYPTTYAAYETKKETTTETPDVPGGDTKAVPGDGKKFETVDTSTIGYTGDEKINLKSLRAQEGGGMASPDKLLNDYREVVAGINQSQESDEVKEKALADAREFLKTRLKELGLNPEDFTL